MLLMVDIGGTKTRLGSSHDLEKLESPIVWDTPGDFEQAMDRLAAEIKKKTGLDRILQTIVGVAGVVDKPAGKIVRAPNLPAWNGKELVKALQSRTGIETQIENDAALGGLGEANFGAGRRKEIVAYIAAGTGVGGARIINGGLDKNYLGFEPGHQILQTSTWEEVCGGRSLQNKYGKWPVDLQGTEIWEEETKNIALGLGNVIVMWSPEIVVLGGSIGVRISAQQVNDLIKERLGMMFTKLPEVVTATLGDWGGLYGGMAKAAHDVGRF
jgi:glucokinase